MQSPASRYRSMQVQTAGRSQLLLLLFDGAIERLQGAQRALAAGNFDTARTPAWRAQAIIMELLQTLDMERGGELAQRLEALYHWWLQQILYAMLDKDPAPLQAVLDQMREQRRAWAEAAAKAPVG